MKTISLIIPLVTLFTSLASAESPKQIELDTLFAKKLEDSIACQEGAGRSCYLRYEGTEIEIVNPRAYKFANIYVHSLGTKQYVLVRGRNCLELIIGNPELRKADSVLQDIGFLIHGSGRIWPALDQDLRAKCEKD